MPAQTKADRKDALGKGHTAGGLFFNPTTVSLFVSCLRNGNRLLRRHALYVLVTEKGAIGSFIGLSGGIRYAGSGHRLLVCSGYQAADSQKTLWLPACGDQSPLPPAV